MVLLLTPDIWADSAACTACSRLSALITNKIHVVAAKREFGQKNTFYFLVRIFGLYTHEASFSLHFSQEYATSPLGALRPR